MASIKCGNCGNYHGSISEVKSCHGIGSETVQVTQPTNPATEKQMNFLRSLLEEREHTFDVETAISVGSSDRKAASKLIQELLECSKREPLVPVDNDAPEVPAGRYAVEDGQTLRFIHVDRPEEGRWAGYLFVKEQAGDEKFPVRNKVRRDALLSLIDEQGVLECLSRYGREIGQCGVCGRTLTDETSRSYGIGPVCRDKIAA